MILHLVWENPRTVLKFKKISTKINTNWMALYGHVKRIELEKLANKLLTFWEDVCDIIEEDLEAEEWKKVVQMGAYPMRKREPKGYCFGSRLKFYT